MVRIIFMLNLLVLSRGVYAAGMYCPYDSYLYNGNEKIIVKGVGEKIEKGKFLLSQMYLYETSVDDAEYMGDGITKKNSGGFVTKYVYSIPEGKEYYMMCEYAHGAVFVKKRIKGPAICIEIDMHKNMNGKRYVYSREGRCY